MASVRQVLLAAVSKPGVSEERHLQALAYASGYDVARSGEERVPHNMAAAEFDQSSGSS